MSDKAKDETFELYEEPTQSGDAPSMVSFGDGLPIKEIYASTDNIESFGAPSENSESVHLRYYFHPTWRSQLFPLLGFVIFSIAAIWVSHAVPATVIKGKLVSFGDTQWYLHLPLLVLIPGFLLGKVLINIYDAKYIIDEMGVEAQIGLVSMNLRQPRLRWEDIRGVEPNQTIWERLLGIGSVLVGSAMTNDVEIVMEGVANPRAIQLLIGGERDRRLKQLSGRARTFQVVNTE